MVRASPHEPASPSDRAQVGETATRISYTPCKRGTEVVLWKLTGSGRVRPGTPIDLSATPRGSVLGNPTRIIDANEVMWEFFSKHPLPKR